MASADLVQTNGLGLALCSDTICRQLTTRPCPVIRGNSTRLIRPADWRVMAVPAGIVPAHPVVGNRAAAAAHRQRDPVRCDGVAERRPDLAARMHGRNRLDGHLHDAGYFR